MPEDLTSLSDAGTGSPSGPPNSSNPPVPPNPNGPPGPANPNGPWGVHRQTPREEEPPDCGPGPNFTGPDDDTDPADFDNPIDSTATSMVGPATGGTSGWSGGSGATGGWAGGSAGRITGDAWSTDGTGRGGQAGGAFGPAGGVGAPGSGVAGAGRGRPGAGGFGGGVPPGSRGDDEDKEHTRPDWLIEPDPNALFGTDESASAPVIGENWKLEE